MPPPSLENVFTLKTVSLEEEERLLEDL